MAPPPDASRCAPGGLTRPTYPSKCARLLGRAAWHLISVRSQAESVAGRSGTECSASFGTVGDLCRARTSGCDR